MNDIVSFHIQDMNLPMRKSRTIIITDQLHCLASTQRQKLGINSDDDDDDDDTYNAEEHDTLNDTPNNSSYSPNKQHTHNTQTQKTLWSQLILSSQSQYSYDSTASCTIMALECAMQFQLEHKNYVPLITPDQDKISQILRIASMYKSDVHTDVEDIMESITRYKEHLRREKFNQILVPNWQKLSTFITNSAKEWNSEISAVVTKPPETIFIHFSMPYLSDGSYVTCPLIFDSHTRTERNFHGAHILRFEDVVSFEEYLKILWPYINMGSNPNLRENQVNTVNIDIITLDPNLREKPRTNVSELQTEFDALAARMQPWKYQNNYNEYKDDGYNEYNEYNASKHKMNVSMDNTKNEEILKEKNKTIKGLEKAVETLNDFLKTKVIKINDAEKEIKTLKNDKQQLLQDKESVRDQYNALAQQLIQMVDEENVSILKKELIDTKKKMNDMESDLNIEKSRWKANEIANFDAEFQSMIMAKDEEIKRIKCEKDKVIGILKQQIEDLLIELKPFREEKKRMEELNRSYECPICFVEYKVQNDAFLMDCDHLINRECALQTFKADIMQNKILPRCPQCLAEKVTTFITPQQLECVMDPQILGFYYQLSLNVALQEANILHCPTADCPFFAEIPNDLERFNCSKCGYSYCTKCKRAYHHNETCDEYKKRKCKEELMSEEQLAKLAEKMGWKQCPKCRTYIERSVGCFHMKCGNAQCQAEYCDGCGKELDSKNWRTHFNPPNKCRLWNTEKDLLNDDEQKQD